MEQAYLELLKEVLESGNRKSDRTGTGTRSLFGRSLRTDLQGGFPLLTTKKVHFKSVAIELLWFLRGEGNINWLRENKVTIWDEWANESGDLGPVYGVQWRSWPKPDGGTVDQIESILNSLKSNPDSRRHIVSAWNVGMIEQMALPPCHLLFQFYIAEKKLSCLVYQRSADIFLGVPFNIASYALLTHMMAHVLSLEPGDLVFMFGDVHLYENHVVQAQTQLGRQPYELPLIQLNKEIKDLFQFQYEDFQILNYHHHPALPAPVAV